jgi:WD40 repeat protein
VTVALAAPHSPYKGLAAFDDSDLDALLFFGRERESEVIAANLMAARATVLFGPSGVGKTSVIRAGVAYRLRREEEVEVVVFSSWPGDPLTALIDAVGGSTGSLVDAVADAANRAGGDLYLILDQFEEYFLYHEHDHVFVQALAELGRRPGIRVNILIGIREETLAHLDRFKTSIPNVLSNRLRLQRLDRAAGKAAIVGPIARYNDLVEEGRSVTLEPDLVEAVLEEVEAGRVELSRNARGRPTDGSDSGRIEAPYLQLVMARLWDVEVAAGSRILRLETLRELGGAAQIVEDHLEHAMGELNSRQKDVAAEMYRFLVTPSGTKIAHDVRDLAGYAEVEENEAEDVLRRLSAERIVRSDSDNGTPSRYEIYHDVLADAVVAWRARHSAEHALRDAERRRRRALGIAAAALAALVIVAAVAVYALVERSHSRSQAQRAHARELVARATGEFDTDPQQGLHEAVRAARLEPGPQEERVLREALSAANQRAVLRADGPVNVVLFDPAGRLVVTGARDGKIRVYRAGAIEPERVMDEGSSVTAADFSPDGRLLLTAGRGGDARLWTPEGVLVRRFTAGGPVRTAFLADGARLVVTLADTGVIRVWRASNAVPLRTIHTEGDAIPRGGSADPSGTLLATFGRDRFAHVYSLVTGALVHTFAQNALVHCAVFSPQGARLITCGHEGTVRVWSARTGRLLKELPGSDKAVLDAVFSPNGLFVAAAVADGTGRIWDTQTGMPVATLFAHANPTTKVAFSPTGNAVATGSPDTRARTWFANGKPASVLAGHSGPIKSLAFSPDGRLVLTGSEDGTARLWRSSTEAELMPVARQSSITAFALSPDRKLVAVGDRRGIVRVRAVGRKAILQSFRASGAITAVAFGRRGAVAGARPTLSIAVSPDGNLVARGRSNGTILLQGRANRRARILHAGHGGVTALSFSPDGQVLASGSADGTIFLWERRRGRVLASLRGHELAITSLAFSPNGALLLSASRDRTARTWHVGTHRPDSVHLWHFGPLGGASFSADGRWIITAGPNATGVGLVSSKQPFMRLRGATDRYVGAGFAGANGRLVIAASRDGTIRQYRCDVCGGLDELLVLAERRLRSR